MITNILNIYYKEWIRTGSIIKLVQLFIVLIFPIMMFTLIFIIPVIMNKSRVLSTASAGFFVFIITGIYSLIYKMESENRINQPFPIDYLPVRKHSISLVHIIFTTIVVSSVIYISYYSALLLIDVITFKVLQFHAFSILFRIMQPFFAGLVFIVFSAVIMGSLLGIIGRKILDNVSDSMRRFVTLLYFVLLFVLLKPYFSSIWDIILNNQFNNALYRFSPINWALSFANMADGNTDIPVLITGLVFILAEVVIIGILSYVTFIGSREFELKSSTSTSVNFSIMSPLWNVMLNRWFTMPIIIFMIVWVILIITMFLTRIMWLNIPISLGFFIYTLIAMDRMFAGRDEDYRKLFEGLPVSAHYSEGVMLGCYYFLYLLPMLGLSYAQFGHLMINMNTASFPATLSGTVLRVFPTSMLYAVIPSIMMFFPYMWSSNRGGKILKKRMIVLYFFSGYFFIASVAVFASGYYMTPTMRDIINSLFWNRGYWVGKIFLYVMMLLSLLIHIRSVYLIIRSFLTRN